MKKEGKQVKRQSAFISFIKKPIIKNILFALAIIVFGFILLSTAFLLDALFQRLIDLILSIFIKGDLNMDLAWFPPLKHGLFAIVILIISWFMFKSKLKTIFKAIYMPVPLAAVFATIGIFFYQLPIIVYFLGILFFLIVLFYLYKSKKPWPYYFTLILVSIVMLLVMILGVEI
jgi:hypothetical protein